MTMMIEMSTKVLIETRARAQMITMQDRILRIIIRARKRRRGRGLRMRTMRITTRRR